MLLNDLKHKCPTLSVGLLTADLMDLTGQIRLLQTVGVTLLHLDVMDGCIWPNITVGASFVQGLKTSLFKDVHLLIDKPERQIENFIRAGADVLTFSVESCGSVAQTLHRIGQMQNANDPARGIVKGLSLNPSTPVETLTPFLDELDVAVLLAVGPDSGGRHALSALPEKVSQVRKMKPELLIFVDGAIKKETIAQVAAMGADVAVTGSAVFDGKDPAGNATVMLDAIRKGRI
jgi:ribulose-phosphate 3-epimerase